MYEKKGPILHVGEKRNEGKKIERYKAEGKKKGTPRQKKGEDRGSKLETSAEQRDGKINAGCSVVLRGTSWLSALVSAYEVILSLG